MNLSSIFKGAGRALGNIATGALGGAAVGLASDALGRLFGGSRRPSTPAAQGTVLPNQELLNEASMRAFRAMSPEFLSDARVRAMLTRRANEQGGIQAAQLRASGAPASAQRGAMIGNQNMATTRANDYLTSLSDPETLARAYMAQMSALNPMFALYLQGQQSANAQRLANMQAEAMRPPSLFENVLSVAGSTAPYWLDSVFRPTVPRSLPNLPNQNKSLTSLYKN